MNTTGVTSQQIGDFIDGVAGKARTPKAVAGRLIEEVVELCLATGMSIGDIHGHIADSLFNQSTKLSKNSGFTVFPSKLNKWKPADSIDELSDECADVSLVLKDLCHITKVELAVSESSKFERLKTLAFHVSPEGTIYTIKPHIK